jgi:hypothetical protein
MNESYQEEIDKLIAKFSLVILAELGHKLPMDQVKSLAKAITVVAMEELDKEEYETHFWMEAREYYKSQI